MPSPASGQSIVSCSPHTVTLPSMMRPCSSLQASQTTVLGCQSNTIQIHSASRKAYYMHSLQDATALSSLGMVHRCPDS